MPPRNLNVILIAAIVSFLCYATYRRARTAMMVGDALELIDIYYVDEVDDKELLSAAMNGMTSSLDQHSSFIPGDAYESFQDSINQEFAGIGIFVDQPNKDEPVRVITPLVNSPALKSGILPNDKIVVVDDIDVSKMELRDVSAKLKGPVGTKVNIQVLRGEDERVSMSVERQTIELESVIGDHRDENDRWVYRLKSEPTVAYIALTSFGEKSVKELSRVLSELNNDFDALVLDLRGNSGGLLYAARDISDMFINDGPIVSTRTRGGVIEEEYAAQPGTLVDTSRPLAILIDGNSASASEIVAACLQDNKRATIVGSRSYGKGTVQNILPLQYGRSALRLTVARYYRPNGENIHRKKDAPEEEVWGVTPDEGFTIEIDEKTLFDLAMRRQEASYPLLNAKDQMENETAEDAPPDDGTTKEDGATKEDDVPESNTQSSDAADSVAGHNDLLDADPLNYDPQLRAAVRHLLGEEEPAVEEVETDEITKAAA